MENNNVPVEGTKTTKLIYERMSAVMREIGAVDKNQVNQQQRFNFRGIDDVYNAVSKIMAKHQVFTTVEIEPISRTEIVSKNGGKGVWVHNRYHYTFHTVDGSSVITSADGEALDYGDKASNKAAAISHKYALIQSLCIPTKLDDPDSESNEVTNTPQDDAKKATEIYGKLDAIGLTRTEVIQMLGYDISSGIKPGDMGKLGMIYNQHMEKTRAINSMAAKGYK